MLPHLYQETLMQIAIHARGGMIDPEAVQKTRAALIWWG